MQNAQLTSGKITLINYDYSQWGINNEYQYVRLKPRSIGATSILSNHLVDYLLNDYASSDVIRNMFVPQSRINPIEEIAFSNRVNYLESNTDTWTWKM